MPAEQVHLVIRKPLSEIEQELRHRYGVKRNLVEVAIEQDALVFTFEGAPHTDSPSKPLTHDSNSTVPKSPIVRTRRKKRIRNRMKTRGWDVVAKFVNTRGQSCTIYRPFYDALLAGKLKRREAYSAVREILVSNDNNPKPSSVDYFLNNTLEYIQRRGNTALEGSVPRRVTAARNGKEDE